MRIKISTLAIIAVTLYALYSATTKVLSNIEYGFTKFQLGRIQTENGQIKLGVRVIQPITNKTSIPFPLDALQGQMVYGNDAIADFRLPARIVIAPGETTNLTLESTIGIADAITEIQEIARTGQYLQALRFRGTASTTGVTVPFDHTVTIG